ncbi:DEAD/DEAH box helicase family protein [Methanotrichaceae archaeon M04Ac]|uniref:DEAD/DEAH box helicase family protein n=1 Tax=Candidatus Methanocrinis alkalitolerans TaxID=3033395 RepID=A0ABT5XC14_9EURY|nr:DEAD/DEAH box helicase family protein [Candidatus Methanocrinis alkalitolerans]MDF0592210.1 DEAD/DEAH box helicase family protein [Candidatus Methanocrinis alkalitolerans]
MKRTQIDTLIINSPYERPSEYWKYDPKTTHFERVAGRRPAGYVIASGRSGSYDDSGVIVEIPLVNKIRERVDAWREKGYPGVTGITRRLLEHWNDPQQRNLRFFFCQLEAIETLIWLSEAPDAEKVGIEIPSDGGSWQRLCSKMATGSGKTIVMAMLIAWQALNKTAYPQDARFSKYFLVVAPGLTVRSRLQVLIPSAPGNYYDVFGVVPTGLREKLNQAKVKVVNWHALNWETPDQIAKKKGVDKRGAKSDEAYVREVLGDMAQIRTMVVINDEAHHAWRVPAESKIKGFTKEEIEEATKWVGGLDRIHRTRNIQACYDFSATPFAPTGKTSSEAALFPWIVSDFGLNDAIESGLVKTPRMVIRDDALPDSKTYKSKLYHIYNDPDVREDLSRKAEEHEPLPKLVTNAYYLLGTDWLAWAKRWEEEGSDVPPVMITVTNKTETAARIKYAFDHNKFLIEELCDPAKTLHIDSKVMKEAESQEDLSGNVLDLFDDEETDRKLSKKDQAQLLRILVDTVGKKGKPGEKIQNVISVGMLSEGWDTKTVTHIMGLRAFSSQLLCEQVVGRGLRRISYEINKDGKFDPEYVNIFGVPFAFLPHESKEGIPGPQPKPKTQIEPDPEKMEFEIKWPNLIRIEHQYKPHLTLKWDEISPLTLDISDTITKAELARIIGGNADLTNISEIDLRALAEKFRMQRIVFETARDVYDQMKPDDWKGDKFELLAQVVHLVEEFLASDKIRINPPNWCDDLQRRILLTSNMGRVVQHIWQSIYFQNTESMALVTDKEKPIRSTGDMGTWYTGKPCERAAKSHINFCVLDSTWEACEAFELDHNPHVKAWAKNDHLGFDIYYIFEGKTHRYLPDFIIKLDADPEGQNEDQESAPSGNYLVLETKGRDTQKDKIKRDFLDEWVRAVNEDGGFGYWQWAVSRDPADVRGIIGDEVSKAESKGREVT